MSKKQSPRPPGTPHQVRSPAQVKPASSQDGSPAPAVPPRPKSTPARPESSPARSNQSPARPNHTLAKRHTMPAKSPQSLRVRWRTWSELTVKLDGLPLGVTSEHLWAMFSSYGNISWMEISAQDQGRGPVSAKIRFEPPPKLDFWSAGTVRREHPNKRNFPRGLTITVALLSTAASARWRVNKDSHRREYPCKMTESLRQLDFGDMVGPTAMTIMRSITASSAPRRMRLELDVKYKRVTVYFSVPAKTPYWTNTRQFCVKIDISTIKNVYQTTSADESVVWVLPLSRPPQYFWRTNDIDITLANNPQTWSDRDTWFRATDIAEDLEMPMNYPVAIHNIVDDSEYVEIGRWTTFRLVLAGNPNHENKGIQQLRMALEDVNVTVVNCGDFQFQRGGKTMWDYLDHPPSMAKGQASALLQMAAPSIIHLPFNVRYQLEVCVSRGILNEHTVTAEFLQTLAALKPFDATRRLEYLADQNEPLFDPMQLFTNLDAESYVPNTKTPYYCTLVQKAVVTPTTVRFNSPTVETSNRVVRKYSHMQDRFLRVQFTEEVEQARLASNKLQNDQVWKRVLRALYKGIRIGDRVYEFLGFGSSQLRQCGAYFFCPTEHVSCEDIRRWMGDLNHIRVVAKYAARLGQCFSTTREIRSICRPTMQRIPDIERDGYCFTDGVGIVSQFLASFIIQEMDLDVLDEPTAFQFRMGGCKGVLTVWPQAKGMEVLVRESQEKFKAKSNGLEIVRCARFSSATLNRQTITILESLGVPTSAYLNLLENQIRDYQSAMEDNSVAIALLTKFVDENRSTLILADLLKAGFKSEDVQEPFTMNLLKLWRSWSLKLLKEKARIHVPKSAFVLGCVDESGTLRGHSKIFLQLTDPTRCDQTIIVKGVCIVGRNPSLHPGDIRVVQAVENPRLRHLKDVVVFSSKGDRPVPNMLSGGDLDGDDFFVVWDPALIPGEWNFPPMDYSGPKPRKLSRDVNVDDIRDFFVKYMKYNVLPLIAHAHLAHADMSGPKSQQCLLLADLHSKAVDYPKTGEPAELGPKLQPKKWPHFMEKRNSYVSKKALGVIFDKVVKRTVEFRPDWQTAFDQRIITRFELDQDTLDTARSIKTQYDICVRRVLAQHDVATEFELYTTWAMSTPETENQYKRQENLGREFDILKARFREQCYEASGSDPDKLEQFVAAMYVVTDETGNAVSAKQLEAKSMPLISFPWIYHGILAQIATGIKHEPKKSRLAAAWHSQYKFAPLTARHSPVLAADGEDTKSVSPTASAVGLAGLRAAATSDSEAPEELGSGIEGNELAKENGEEAVEQISEEKRKDDCDLEAVDAGEEPKGENAMDRLASLMGFDEDEGFD
ncbi:RNA dependent RNA polymerase domain-containing protein [Hirsutella rhossiliensis]|uniref:RNA-dependent RNA polymerase n=1 Tax=Hirsutella rhossiliensis TaxID=111463 RepID=A0A9P8SJW4_9HYPO|nr:RNA dependent RNA polymerase domain-containing protein [Hirsutella rhossiliensis]KAH0964145.1 RNA dependent RNA polymerase domain-containing protein [Hirsutella rhossiliensis]